MNEDRVASIKRLIAAHEKAQEAAIESRNYATYQFLESEIDKLQLELHEVE